MDNIEWDDFSNELQSAILEFIEENYADDAFYNMDELDEIFTKGPWEAIRSAFYGGRYGHQQDSFTPCDEYFYFNGYGNLMSLPEYLIGEYIKDNVPNDEFRDWAYDNGYEDEADEYDKILGITDGGNSND